MPSIQIDADAARSGWVAQIVPERGDADNSFTRGNVYLKVLDYIEGTGAKPTAGVGQYLSATGYVDTQEAATNVAYFTGEDIMRYLKDVGLTVNELPIVSVADDGCILGVENGEWGIRKNIRGTLLATRENAVDNEVGDSMLLPDPRSLADDGHRVVAVYRDGFPVWQARSIRDEVQSVAGTGVSNYDIEVVDSLPSNADDNTLYFVRAS